MMLTASRPVAPAPPPPSLDSTVTTARDAVSRRRRGRGYQRIISGLQKQHRPYRLLTLTTLAGVRDTPEEFQADWRKLKERLRRRKLLPAYIRVLEYTKSGLPHAHILTAGGGYLPQWWISQLWAQIHGAMVTDIRMVAKRSGKHHWQGHEKVAGYLAKYMGKDQASRLAYSPQWLWPGLAASWRGCWRACAYLRLGMAETVRIWTLSCVVGVPPARWGPLVPYAARLPAVWYLLRGYTASGGGYTWGDSKSSSTLASVSSLGTASTVPQAQPTLF